MKPELVLTQDDLKLIHEHLSFEEARNVKAILVAMDEFETAADKAAAAQSIAQRLKPLGIRGLSLKTLYRKSAEVAKHGWRGAVDGRTLRKLNKVGLGSNQAFVDHWATLVAENQRKTAPAYRALLDAINRGESIPGLGTWRDIWQREHPGETPPSVCPFGTRAPNDQVPRNMSYSALMRLKPTAFGIRASRVGTMSASMDFLMDVIRTRVGLKRCQVIQIDDMWDNSKVVFGDNRLGERVLELSAVDVLTGKIICYLSKPIIRNFDDTRQTLKTEWTRYLIAHVCCNLGIPEKMLIMGERGTASVDNDFKAMLTQVSNSAITFGAGGMLSKPIAKGLYEGTPKGNPKYKGLIESLHGYKQNEMANIKGQIGSRDSMGNEPESVYGMAKTEKALATVVAALEERRPGIKDRLAWPWLPLDDYAALKAAAYDAINRRTEHNMEGWEACGFLVAEWRPGHGMPWMPMSALDGLGADAAMAMRRVIESTPSLFRARRMSPEEAWLAREGEVKPLGDWAMPILLGENLARVCKVSPKLMMEFKDESTMRKHTVYALIDGCPLPRGQEYLVWINPCDCSKAYIAELQGQYIGVAPVAQAGTPDDMEALKHSLGIRQLALSEEVERLRPIANKRLKEANAAAAQNAKEILGYDPAQNAIVHAWVNQVAAPVDMDDFMPIDEPEPVGVSVEDLI